jgi:drug/metabolite transporter (DMT)-like permease
MTQRLLRLVYAVEFLVALVAIFTAWSEIGGQAVLDLMRWEWKLGLSLALATTIVGFSAAMAAEDKLWTLRSARWLAALLVCMGGMAAVTYFYSLQTDGGDPEENGTVSVISPTGKRLSLL